MLEVTRRPDSLGLLFLRLHSVKKLNANLARTGLYPHCSPGLLALAAR
jgi:hypothetical protein